MVKDMKWQYLIAFLLTENELKLLGLDEWELVAVEGKWYFFKKPLVEPVKETLSTNVTIAKKTNRR